MNALTDYAPQIGQLCRRYHVARLYSFGSLRTNRFSEKSDIDLLVAFESVTLDEYATNYFNLKFSLEELLHRPVDLLEEKAIRNPHFRQEIDAKRQLIYGQ